MPLDVKDAARVYDMLEHARIVARLVSGRAREELGSDDQLRLALERLVEIIGEAARKVSADGRATCPDIPWQKIVRQRHVLAHDYGDVDHDILWRVVTTHVPALIPQLKAILPPIPPDPLPEEPEETR